MTEYKIGDKATFRDVHPNFPLAKVYSTTWTIYAKQEVNQLYPKDSFYWLWSEVDDEIKLVVMDLDNVRDGFEINA